MKPLRIVFKLTSNVILGGIVLSLLNLIGAYFSFHVNINILSTLITGLLGVPGIILLVALKSLFRV